MDKILKLFVWKGFAPDYTDGLAFAIAENETEARKLIIKKIGFNFSEWGNLKIKPLNKKTSFAVAGGS